MKPKIIQVLKQISTKTKPIFSDKSKCIFMPAGCDINVYNCSGGDLINVLEKHEEMIIGICKSKLKDEEKDIISCDEKLNIFHWKITSNNNNNDAKLLSLPSLNNPTYFGVGINNSYLIGCLDPTSDLLSLFLYKSPYKKSPILIDKNILKGSNTITTNNDGSFLAAVKEDQLLISKHPYCLNNQFTRYHRTKKKLRCLAYHPLDNIVAVGDISGAITLWYNLLDKYPVKNIIHWHTLPVGDLSFSFHGTELYSGGGECVVVRWHLTENNRKSFLPRLGMPIQFLTTDSSNTHLAVVHVDRAISIINTQELVLEGLIQTLSLHFPQNLNGPPLPVGLLHHSRSDALVMNGKTGHLQFFHHPTSKILYHLDIVMSNFVSNERGEELSNSEVTLVSIADDGSWLVTIEVCDVTENMKEVYLKFWFYSVESQRWELNTSIQMPHSDTINCLSLHSFKSTNGGMPSCVTCAEDGKFKIWKLLEYKDVQGLSRNHWNSRAVREYKGWPSTASSFSPDNSILAVAFNAVITLWSTGDDCTIVGSLSQHFLSERIRDVCFSYGEHEGSRIISRSDNWLCCWDLLSCSLKWRVSLKTSCLAVDQMTGVFVVFSRNKKFFFFDTQSNEPIMQLNNSSEEVLGACFTPSVEKFAFDADVPWRSNNSLYFLDNKQILFSVQNVDDLDTKLSKTVKNSLNKLTSDSSRQVDKTLYSALIARTRHITRKNMDVNFVNSPLSQTTSSLLEELRKVTIHNMDTVTNLATVLKSFPPPLERIQFPAQKSTKYDYLKEDYESGPAHASGNTDDLGRTVEAIQNISYEDTVDSIQS